MLCFLYPLLSHIKLTNNNVAFHPFHRCLLVSVKWQPDLSGHSRTNWMKMRGVGDKRRKESLFSLYVEKMRLITYRETPTVWALRRTLVTRASHAVALKRESENVDWRRKKKQESRRQFETSCHFSNTKANGEAPSIQKYYISCLKRIFWAWYMD